VEENCWKGKVLILVGNLNTPFFQLWRNDPYQQPAMIASENRKSNIVSMGYLPHYRSCTSGA
jgi:hypothetical protein